MDSIEVPFRKFLFYTIVFFLISPVLFIFTSSGIYTLFFELPYLAIFLTIFLIVLILTLTRRKKGIIAFYVPNKLFYFTLMLQIVAILFNLNECSNDSYLFLERLPSINMDHSTFCETHYKDYKNNHESPFEWLSYLFARLIFSIFVLAFFITIFFYRGNSNEQKKTL